MKHASILIATLALTMMMSGCSHTPDRDVSQAHPTPNRQPTTPNPTDTVKKKLYAQYQQWKGTQYQMGGLSKQGIDCSGLVYTTYRDRLGIKIPRSTQLQAQIGTAVKREQLRAGDLVFFNTGTKVRHVGIYIEDGKFLHVSTKAGVKISKLSDYYWKDRYWHSRRVGI